MSYQNNVYVTATEGRATVNLSVFNLRISSCQLFSSSATEPSLLLTAVTMVTQCYLNSSGSGIEIDGDGQRIDQCYIIATDGVEFSGASSYIDITGCYIFATDDAIMSSTSQQVDRLLVGQCHLLGDNGLIENSTGIFEDVVIEGCGIEVSQNGISATAERISITDNYIYDGANDGIVLSVTALGNRVTIADNHIVGFNGNAIDVTGAELHLDIHDNIIDSIGNHGIVISDCDHAHIHHNRLNDIGTLGANTYDCIQINGDSSRNMVDGNILTASVGGGVTPRYGVNVGGTGECNMVVGNDLGDPNNYGSDALTDSASNTQLFWPADATYGDNFTDCGSGS